MVEDVVRTIVGAGLCIYLFYFAYVTALLGRKEEDVYLYRVATKIFDKAGSIYKRYIDQGYSEREESRGFIAFVFIVLLIPTMLLYEFLIQGMAYIIVYIIEVIL